MSSVLSVGLGMKLRLWCMVLSFAVALPLAQAQFSKTIHNSIEADSADVITVDLAGEVSVEPWAGNTILVETQIRLYNATKGVFEYFVEQAGRYDVLHEQSGNSLRVYSKDMARKIIQTKHGQSEEEVTVRVMLPRAFADTGSGSYRREAAEESDL